jgi:hypothetical protein
MGAAWRFTDLLETPHADTAACTPGFFGASDSGSIARRVPRTELRERGGSGAPGAGTGPNRRSGPSSH